MKKILIIANGQIADSFIERVIATYSSDNIYYVVHMGQRTFENYNPAMFKFYYFDPTSFSKLSNLLKMDFVQVIVALEEKFDVQETLKNIRNIKKELRVIVYDSWNLPLQDPNMLFVNVQEIMSSRLIDYLPNVPVIAQNVGMGEGEIMEVLVPFGSSFVYRHLGAIEQKKWRIVGIYRNKELLLPNNRRMIHPNDLLLLVGEPAVLKSVYRAIKRQLGQFPAPFGSNLYLVIDMDVEKTEQITDCVRRAAFINRQFEHQLVIKVFNPSDIETVNYIKSYRSEHISIEFVYLKTDSIKTIILNDIKQYHIGLVILSRALFAHQSVRKVLYKGNVPVLKLAEHSFSKLKDVVALASGNSDMERIATTIFDVTAQLNFNLELIDYLQEQNEKKEQVIENFNNLSTIFSKNIRIISSQQNPIRMLKRRSNFLQALPFSDKVLKEPLFSLFSTDKERLYHYLDSYHQIFIPVRI